MIKVRLFYSSGRCKSTTVENLAEANDWLDDMLYEKENVDPFELRLREEDIKTDIYAYEFLPGNTLVQLMRTENRDVVDSLDIYQDLAALTALYPEHTALEYLLTGLAGEVGEVHSKMAKQYRADNDRPLDVESFCKELGDVLWFVSELARYFNMSLSEIANTNIEKLQKRQLNNTIKGSGDER